MTLVVPMLIVILEDAVQSVNADQVMSETHLSIATSSLAAKPLVEPTLNVNPRADLPSVNVQGVILVIPTPTVSEILVVLIHVVPMPFVKTTAMLLSANVLQITLVILMCLAHLILVHKVPVVPILNVL